MDQGIDPPGDKTKGINESSRGKDSNSFYYFFKLPGAEKVKWKAPGKASYCSGSASSLWGLPLGGDRALEVPTDGRGLILQCIRPVA